MGEDCQNRNHVVCYKKENFTLLGVSSIRTKDLVQGVVFVVLFPETS